MASKSLAASNPHILDLVALTDYPLSRISICRNQIFNCAIVSSYINGTLWSTNRIVKVFQYQVTRFPGFGGSVIFIMQIDMQEFFRDEVLRPVALEISQ
jgi:hypothetical protein